MKERVRDSVNVLPEVVFMQQRLRMFTMVRRGDPPESPKKSDVHCVKHHVQCLYVKYWCRRYV
jgi:hypothetical protein